MSTRKLGYRSLISENGKDVSAGRMLLIIVFIFSSYFWLCPYSTEFPDTLYKVLIALLCYNFGKKLTPAVTTYLTKDKP